MVTLYRFFPAWGFGCVSQFVLKIETYLRMTETPFSTCSVGLAYGETAPKGKLPYIEHNGKKIPDSVFIVDYLKKEFGDKLDKDLSPMQRAMGTLIMRTVEEDLRWAMAYERWTSPDEPYYNTSGFQALPRAAYDGARDYFVGQIKSHGIHSHTADEVAQIGAVDLEALSTVLGSQKFFLGDKPTSYDASAYGFLAHVAQPAYKNSRLKASFDKHANLGEFVKRVYDMWFKDKDPISTQRDIATSK